MANQYKGEVALEVNGATYTLDFTTNAIIELQDKFQKLAETVFIELQQMISEGDFKVLKSLRTILYCALQEHHPAITEKEVGKMMSGDGAKIVFPKLLEAIKLSFPTAEPSEARATDANPQ